MKIETIDVILPFHRVNRELLEAIDSIHNSKDVSVRVVAVNDSGQNVFKADLQLKDSDVLIESKNSGYLGAMATGVQAVTSQYIAFLDSDDIIHPLKLAIQLNELLKHHRDIVTCKIVKFTEETSDYVDFHVLGDIPSVLTQEEKLIFGAHGADSSILIRRDVLQSTWSNHASFPSHLADYGWLLQCLNGLNVGFVEQPLYFYRSHASQMSRASDLDNEWTQIHDLWLGNLRRQFIFLSSNVLEINEAMSRFIAFPLSFPRLTMRERARTREVLIKIRAALVRSHPNLVGNNLDFINFRINLLEFGLNPFHIVRTMRLISNIVLVLFRAKGIKRR